MAISDLVQLQLGWLNAWIPSFALVLIQFLYMLLYKEGGKRAVDTSWHTAKDKRYATSDWDTAVYGRMALVRLCACRIHGCLSRLCLYA